MSAIRWGRDHRTLSPYQKHHAWLCGALAAKRGDGSLQEPRHPELAQDFRIGRQMFHEGMITLADDFDPGAFIARLKADHKIRYDARVAP
jgi:hypothetical protein